MENQIRDGDGERDTTASGDDDQSPSRDGSTDSAEGSHEHDANETADNDSSQSQPSGGHAGAAGDSVNQDIEVGEPVDDSEKAKERETPPIPKHAPSTAQDASAIVGTDLMKFLLEDIPLITRILTEYCEK